MVENAYSKAGVDVEAGYEVVERIKKHVARTERLGVIGALGGFGGAFDLSALKKYDEPVLISGTDGVGTKLLLAIEADKHDTIGIDAVAMCVNDIIAAGAEPLYFLDYIATGKNVPEQLEQVVAGVAEGCVQAGAALIGGETAEMPGMYEAGHYDLAGFAVGIAEKRELIDGERDCQTGDVLIGLPSSGLHSNGFSLVRKIVAENGLTDLIPELLTPTKIYVKDVLPLVKQGLIQGIAHITGGGFIENVPRMFGKNLTAVIDKGSWPVKPIFTQLQEAGKLDSTEVYEYFNMGIGMVLTVKPSDAAEVLRQTPDSYEIGRLTAFDGQPVVIK